MSSTREIKNRIKSVQSTAKITRALEMVSASKMLKAQERAYSTAPYAQGLYEIVSMIGNIREYKSPYLREVDQVNKVLVIIVGPSRGFVGSLTSDLAGTLDKYIDELRLDNSGVVVEAVTVGKLGQKIAGRLNLKISHHFEGFGEKPTQTEISALVEIVKKGFEGENFDEVHIAYSHIISTVEQKSVVKKLLPLSFELEDREEVATQEDYIFEPSIEEVLDSLLPEYFEIQLLSSLIETTASEHSARMVAMKNATDSAEELNEELVLKYNKTRQSKITEEINDIVGGSVN